MKNVVFIVNTPEILKNLHMLGLELHAVRVNSKPYLMVVTTNLSLMQKFARSFDIGTFYISDSRRSTFQLDLSDRGYIPTKLGALQRVETVQPGAFLLQVTEDGKSYNYFPVK